MDKIFTYVFIIVGLMALFYVAGLTEKQGTVLGLYNITGAKGLSDFKITNIWTAIKTNIDDIAGGGLGGIIAGAAALATGNLVIILAAAIVGAVLGLFLSDLNSIVQILNAQSKWIGWLTFLIMAPIVVGYVIALYQWIKGGGD